MKLTFQFMNLQYQKKQQNKACDNSFKIIIYASNFYSCDVILFLCKINVHLREAFINEK